MNERQTTVVQSWPARPRVALALTAATLVITSGMIGLLETTETRYAEIGREMLASGDWVTPHLNGLPHFDKPPLAYWATAAGLRALGTTPWGARIPVVIASLAGMACFVLAVRRRFATLRVSPALALWVLASTLMFAVAGRTVGCDPYLAAAVCGFWAFAGAWGAPLALALGMLAKGPVVLLPTVVPVLLLAALHRRRDPLALLGPAVGWLGFALLALPWFVIVALRTPGWLDYMLGRELWARFTDVESHHRGGPPWYFVVVLLAGAMPWTAALIAGLIRVWRGRRDDAQALLLLWLFVPLLVFSCSASKLPAYLLPALPAAALIAAAGLTPLAAWVRIASGALMAGGAVACWTLGPRAIGWLMGGAGGQGPLPRAAYVAIACFTWAAFLMWRSRPMRAALLVVLGWTALVVSLVPFEAPLGSPRAIARVLIENRAPHEPVVEVGRFNAGIPFALGETVRLLEVPRELRFADSATRARVLANADTLAWLAATHTRVWLFGPARVAREVIGGRLLSYQPVARWKGSTLAIVQTSEVPTPDDDHSGH